MKNPEIVNIHGKRRHPDGTLLELLSIWHLARAEARLEWAKYDRQTLFSTIEGNAASAVVTAALDQMAQAEGHIANMEPVTTCGVQHLLEAAAEILLTNKRNPEATMGEGPVIEMILNAARAAGKKDIVLGD